MEGQAVPPTVPTPDAVSDTPPEFVPGPTEAQTPTEKRTRNAKPRTEFQLLGDIQEAFRAMPTDAARSRAWEWITGWLAEEYPPPLRQNVVSFDSALPTTNDYVNRLLSGVGNSRVSSDASDVVG